jgi:ABC-type multidrug transport system fused ATPase/permease subunit
LPSLLPALFFALVEGCAFPLFSYLLSLIAAVYYDPDTAYMQSQAALYAAYLIGIGGAAGAAIILKTIFLSRLTHTATSALRASTLETLLRRPVAWHDFPEHAHSLLAARLNTHPDTIRLFVTDRLSALMAVVGNIICTVLVCFLGSLNDSAVRFAALGVGVVLPVLAASAIAQTALAASASRSSLEHVNAAAALAADAVASHRLGASYTTEPAVLAAVNAHLRESQRAGGRAAWARAVGYGLSQTGVFFAYALMFYYGGREVARGQMDLGTLVRVFMAVQTSSNQIAQIVPIGAEWSKTKDAMADVAELVDDDVIHQPVWAAADTLALAAGADGKAVAGADGLASGKGVSTTEMVEVEVASPRVVTAQDDPESSPDANASADDTCLSLPLPLDPLFPAPAPPAGSALLPPSPPAVRLHRVDFQYPTRPAPVLQQCSIDIPAGAHAAIVGHSGCGKSSVFGLLLRLYDPTNHAPADADARGPAPGTVALGDVDVATLPLPILRARVALVSQDVAILPLSVYGNIRCGHAAVTDEAVVRACKTAHIHDLIVDTLPHGYDTDLTAVTLSGGQRARIGIARALACRPDVLLLDEATAALDSALEDEVQRSLVAATRGMTTVTIAHRLSTIRHCDPILVMQEGRVTEQGTHEELVARGGVYADMVRDGDAMGL